MVHSVHPLPLRLGTVRLGSLEAVSFGRGDDNKREE